MDMTKLPLSKHIEIWVQYGAYLIGVSGIARDFPEVSWDRAALVFQNNGAMRWAPDAMRRAWNAGQRAA
jgi:hypothetical protein